MTHAQSKKIKRNKIPNSPYTDNIQKAIDWLNDNRKTIVLEENSNRWKYDGWGMPKDLFNKLNDDEIDYISDYTDQWI